MHALNLHLNLIFDAVWGWGKDTDNWAQVDFQSCVAEWKLESSESIRRTILLVAHTFINYAVYDAKTRSQEFQLEKITMPLLHLQD